MNIEHQPFDPEERRREAMEEGSGVSTYLAEVRLHPEELDLPIVTSSTKNALGRRAVRPRGRALTEPGGGDVSRDMANRDALEHPMTSEEKEAALRSEGHLEFLTMKGKLAYDRIMRETEGDPRRRALALQKLAEGRY